MEQSFSSSILSVRSEDSCSASSDGKYTPKSTPILNESDISSDSGSYKKLKKSILKRRSPSDSSSSVRKDHYGEPICGTMKAHKIRFKYDIEQV